MRRSENENKIYYPNRRGFDCVMQDIIKTIDSPRIFDFYDMRDNPIYHYFLSPMFDIVGFSYELSNLRKLIENYLCPSQIDLLIRQKKTKSSNSYNSFRYDTFLDEDINGNIRFFIRVTRNMPINHSDSSQNDNKSSGRSVVFVYSYPKIRSMDDEYNIGIYLTDKSIDENTDENFKNLPFCIISSTKEGIEIKYSFWNSFTNTLEEKYYIKIN